MAEYYDVDRITYGGDTHHFKDYSMSASVTTPSPIVSFPDGSPYPMGMQFAVNPVQAGSGDPNPTTNIRPITGWTGARIGVSGKNICSELEQGGIDINGNDLSLSTRIRSTEFIPVKQNTKYTFNVVHEGGTDIYIRYFDSSAHESNDGLSWTVAPATFQTGANTKFIRLTLRDHTKTSSDITPSQFSNAQLEMGESSTSYEPYASNTVYTITFPISAGTVYGGTVTVNPDGTGELVVDRKYYELDGSVDENWGISGAPYKYGVFSGIEPYDTNRREETISNSYVYSGNISNAGSEIGFSINQSTQVRLRYELNTSLTESDVRAYLAEHPLSFVYYIATPVAYSLTPGQVLSLLNLNNVWADTGDIQSLSYVRNTVPEMLHADTVGRVALVRSEVESVESAMVILVDGDTAPKAISSGKYLFIKNHSTLATGIYHATANIANGVSVTSSNVAGDPDGAINALLEMILALQ